MRIKQHFLSAFFCFNWVLLFIPISAKSQNNDEKAKVFLDSSKYARKRNDLSNALNYSIKALNVTNLSIGKKATAHIGMGTSLWALGAYQDAINYLYRAVNIKYVDRGKYDVHDAIVLGSIGSYNLQLQRLDSSIHNFHQAIDILSVLNSSLYYASAYNNLGIAYKELDKLDSAQFAFDKGLKILDVENIDQLLFSAVIFENMAEIAIKENDFLAARSLIEKSIEIIKENNTKENWKRTIPYYKILVSVNKKLDKSDEVKRIASKFFEGLGHYKNISKRYQMAIAVIDDLIDQEDGDNLELIENRIMYSDSLAVELDKQNNRITEGLMVYKSSILEQHKKIISLQEKSANQILALEQAKSKRIFLIAALIIAVAVSVIFYILIKTAQRKKQNALEKELAALAFDNQKLIEKELAASLEKKKSDILQLALDNSKKLEWNNELIGKLKGLRRAEDRDVNKVLRDIELQMGQQLNDDNRSAVLKNKIDTVNEEFIAKLYDLYPSLTKADIELCGHLKLRLGGQEIASIKNVDPKSITKAKQRLKKKLRLDANVDLYHFFREM